MHPARPATVALLVWVSIGSPPHTAEARRGPHVDEVVETEFPITVRAGTLAAHIDTIGGHSVRVPSARVVGVFDPRVFLIESQTPLRPVVGHRDRVLVFI